jgi:hypothetical protein
VVRSQNRSASPVVPLPAICERGTFEVPEAEGDDSAMELGVRVNRKRGD